MTIQVPITKEEKEKLVHDAHQHEMNMSQYIRWLIKKERKNRED